MADATVWFARRQVSNGEFGEVEFIGLVDLGQGQVVWTNNVVAVLQVETGGGDEGAALWGNAKAKLLGSRFVVRVGKTFLDAGAVDHVTRVDSAGVAKVDGVGDASSIGQGADEVVDLLLHIVQDRGVSILQGKKYRRKESQTGQDPSARANRAENT